MLSGVGPAEHLKSVGVPVVKDLSGVGSGLKDHAVIDTRYASKYPDTLDYLKPKTLIQEAQSKSALLQYQLTGTGPLTSNVCNSPVVISTPQPIILIKGDTDSRGCCILTLRRSGPFPSRTFHATKHSRGYYNGKGCSRSRGVPFRNWTQG